MKAHVEHVYASNIATKFYYFLLFFCFEVKPVSMFINFRTDLAIAF
jgi:hypothetical protein